MQRPILRVFPTIAKIAVTLLEIKCDCIGTIGPVSLIKVVICTITIFMYSLREEGRNHLRKSMSPISQFVAETLRVKTILEYLVTNTCYSSGQIHLQQFLTYTCNISRQILAILLENAKQLMSPISQFAAETLSRVIVIDELSYRSRPAKWEELLEFWPLHRPIANNLRFDCRRLFYLIAQKAGGV